MRPLVIGPDEKKLIAAVMEYARAHPWSPLSGTIPGHNPRYVCEIPHGFRCCFTITDAPGGKQFRQLSVSVPGERFPAPEAMVMLGDEFGFQRSSKSDLDITKCSEKDGWLVMQMENCINMAQLIEGENDGDKKEGTRSN